MTTADLLPLIPRPAGRSAVQRSLFAAVVLLGLVASNTRGQDASPVIHELLIDNAPVTSVVQGSVVTAKGRNFHQCPPLPDGRPGEPPPRNVCRHEELRVRLHHDHVLLLESTSERVTFIVPQDIPPGRWRLTISIRGKGEASAELEVVSRGGRPLHPVPAPRLDTFRITRFDLVRDDAGASFVVSGQAPTLPSGFVVDVGLACNLHDVEHALVAVRDGAFEATFGPYTQQLVFGEYAATALFRLSQQPRGLARDFERGRTPEETRVYERLERREVLQLGTEHELTTQTAAMQSHYTTHADDLARLLGDVESWRARPFQPDAYRTWAEETFVPALTAVFRRHRAFRDATIAPIEPRGELPADSLVSIVLETFLQATRELYEGAKLDVPASLLSVPAVDPVSCAPISRRHFEAKARLLLRQIGLRKLAPLGEDDEPVIVDLRIDDAPVTSVPQGGVVTATGRHLHQCPPVPGAAPGQPPTQSSCLHEGLRARLGHRDVVVLESTSERVTFVVPEDMPAGRARLRISLRDRGDASAELEVVLAPPPRPRGPPDPDPIDAFRITRFELVRDDAGARFVVNGMAGRIPDGFSLVVTLSINQRDLEQELVSIDDGRFEATFGPYTRELLHGNYTTTTLFELSKNPRVRVREFRKALGPETAWAYDHLERRENLWVGTAEQVRAQTAAMQAHYRAHGEELLRLLGEVEAWRAQPFKAAAYQAWAEGTFVPALRAAFKNHRAFRNARIAPIEPRAELPADSLVSIVLETFLQTTRELYQAANLAVPASLQSVADVDPVACAEVSRGHFEAQHRLLLRTIGLAPPAEGR